MTEHQCAEHRPGSEACYCSHRCRCGACSTARARYMKRRKHLESQGIALICDRHGDTLPCLHCQREAAGPAADPDTIRAIRAQYAKEQA